MDGIHDLGGRDGFGPVVVEPDEPVFHFEWERRAWGVSLATFVLGLHNGGQFRHAIERMDPVHYLTSRYYEHWITGLATRLVEIGMVDGGELEGRAGGAVPLSNPVVAPPVLDRGADIDEPRFAIGDRVRVRAVSHRGHTRAPQYVRGRGGTVVRIDGSHNVPDVEAHTPDGRARREPLYCVRFDAAELWGDDDASAGASIFVDLWESYLEGAR